MNISVVGSGFVGYYTGKLMTSLGHEVYYYDNSQERIKELTNLGEKAGDDFSIVGNSDASFICVPTPNKPGRERKQDTSILFSLVEKYNKIEPREATHIIVIRSTVLPGTSRRFYSELNGYFDVCFMPEFLTQIPNSWTDDPAFSGQTGGKDVIIGVDNNGLGEYIKGKVLKSKDEKDFIITDLVTAETMKYASNCALASRISYWNEMFRICGHIGADINTITDFLSKDPIIGKYGTVCGKAFGGACLPKDLDAFIGFVSKRYNPKMLLSVKRVNEEMKSQYGVRE